MFWCLEGDVGWVGCCFGGCSWVWARFGSEGFVLLLGVFGGFFGVWSDGGPTGVEWSMGGWCIILLFCGVVRLFSVV